MTSGYQRIHQVPVTIDKAAHGLLKAESERRSAEASRLNLRKRDVRGSLGDIAVDAINAYLSGGEEVAG